MGGSAANGPDAPNNSGKGSRLHTMDGLRGFAALAVLVSHVAPSICPITVLRNWYAVDLFFMISGFVLCRSYESRIANGMTPAQFMRLRYLRLYPLFALGVAIGVIADLLALLAHASPFDNWQRVIATITGFAILPSPTMRATPEIIPLNPVGWSLFFELVANLVYIAFWPRLTKSLLLITVTVSGADLLWSAAHGASFGGTGWVSFWGGFPRVMFCFFTGVLIARTWHAEKRQSPLAWLLMPILASLLLAPWRDDDLRDVVIMMLVFPPIILLAATLEPRRTSLMSCLGRLSYPIYAIHVPLYRCFEHILRSIPGLTPEALAPWSGLGFVATTIVLAHILDTHYDGQVRRWISSRIDSGRIRSAGLKGHCVQGRIRAGRDNDRPPPQRIWGLRRNGRAA